MADPWEKNLGKGTTNPVAPTGLQQAAGRVQQYQGENNGQLPPWLNGDFSNSTRNWVTGANMQGTENGWDYSEGFNAKMQEGYTKAAEEGTLRQYHDFAESKGTGIVQFDYTSDADPDRKYRFGDIYEDGEFVGNLYDEKAMGFSKATANILLSEFMLDRRTKSEIATASDSDERRQREIDAVRERNQTEIPKAWQALETQGKIEEKQESFQSGLKDDVLATLAGAGGGAAVGSAGGPWGALGGAIVGGFGGYMNRDELSQAAARATVVTGMADEEFGRARAIFTGLHQWSGVAGKSLMPLSNTVRGIYDARAGETGDGVEEFHAVDDKGDRQASPLWIAADLGASVGDSLLQFASPLGRQLYTYQMSGNIIGQSVQLATTGQTFDDRRGGFDNIFKDDEGNADPASGAAGIASIGIDVVQLGMVRGLSKSAQSAREQANLVDKVNPGRLRSWVSERTPYSMGGTKGLKEGQSVVHVGGQKFIYDGATGKVVEGSRRASISILAPSEALPYISSGMMARRAAARRPGGPATISTDDYYRAATSLANGQRKVTAAFLNSFGEAGEEAAQAILEPVSHDGRIDPWQVIESAAYGGAMGLGMSLGTTMRAPNQDQRLRAQAEANHLITFGTEMAEGVWEQMSQAEKQSAAAMGVQAEEIARRVFGRIKDEQATTLSANVPEIARLRDAQLTAQESALAKLSAKTDGTFVIGQLEFAGEVDENGELLPGSMPNNAVGSSAAQVFQNLRMHNEGLNIQRAWLQRRIAELQDKGAKQTATEEDALELTQRTRQLATAELTLSMSTRLNEEIGEIATELQAHVENGDRAAAEASVREMNAVLLRAFNRDYPTFPGIEGELTDEQRNALARAATLVFVREPKDQSGSFLSMVPQASMQLSWSGSDNYLQISHSVLAAIGGDYDGDKIRQQAQLLLDDQEFENSRSGSSLLGVAPGPIIGTRDYESYNIANMAKALAAGEKAAELATHHLRQITGAIHRRYTGRMPERVLNAALLRFQDDVATGNPKARARLLDELATNGGEGIMARARETLSNEWLWIDQVVAANLQEFQSAYALYRPQMGTLDTDSAVGPDTTVEAPKLMTATAAMKKRIRRQAATLGQTLGLWTDGPGMFRAFQKLHYSVFGAAVTSSADRDPNALEQLVQIYEAMGQRVSASELELIQSKDEITGRVLVWLEQMAAEAARAFPKSNTQNSPLMIAALQAQDYEIDENGEVKYLPGKITMAQLLLRKSVQMDQVEKAKIVDRDPQLQAKHARLLGMTKPTSPVNAERALVEVFGASPLYSLLGPAAAPLGPHLTPDQFRRKIEGMHEDQRRQEIRAIQADPNYVRTQGPKGETATKSLPYTMEEFVEGTSPYRVMMDALINVSRYELSANENGEVTGEKAERDKQTSEDFQAAARQINDALPQFQRFSPRDGETTAETIRRMLVEMPDLANTVLKLLPDSAIQAVYAADQDGNPIFAQWLYDALAEQDTAKAEMIYWRGLLIAQWNAMGGRGYVADDDTEGEQGRRYSAINRRMHRVMYRLAKSNNSLAYLEFMDALYQADNLEQFMATVNSNPGWRGDQAPLLAWIDDTSEFDMDKTGGGWTKNLSGSELRVAIADLRAHTSRLIDDLKTENSALLEDQGVFIELDRFGTAEETPLSRDYHAKLQAAIDLAGTRLEAVGPGAMVMQGVASVLGFYPSAHTKGQNPSAYRPFGLFDAGRDGYGFLTSFERFFGSLTSVNLDDIGGNPGLLLHGDVRSMDDQGNVIEWEKPSVEQMVEMLRNPQTRSLARAMLFPTVQEATPDGRVTSKFLIGKSVTALLNSTMHQQLFEQRDGRLTHEAAMLYATAVNAGARRWGGTSSDFVRAVNDLVIARTTSSRKVLTAELADRMWNEAAEELAALLQMAGGIRAMERTAGATESQLTQIRDAVQEAARRERARLTLGIPGVEGKLLSEFALEQFITERKEEGAARLAELAAELAAAATPEERDRVTARIEMEKRSIETFDEKVRMLMSSDPFGALVDRLTIRLDANGNVGLESLGAQREVLSYIRSTGTLLGTRVPKVMTTLIKLQNQLADSNLASAPQLTGAEWEELSRALISMKIDDQTSMAPPDLALPLYPDVNKEHERRYMDPTWAYLVTPLLTPGNPLLEEAADLHVQAGRFGVPIEQTELVRHIADVVLDQRRLGDWTSDIPRQSIQANERLDSASAEPAIAMAGNPPKRQATISSATRRTMLMPDESLLSKATLSMSQLNGDLSGSVLVDLATTGQPIPGHQMPLAQLNNRFARSAVLTFQLPNGQSDTVDLMAIDNIAQVGVSWTGDSTVATSGYKVITVERLQHGVERALARLVEMGVELSAAQVEITFFHPDSQPAEPQWMRNVYFEGTSFSTVGDDFTSLNDTLWFAPGSLSPELQAAALDASKLGRPAIKVTPPASPEARAAAEATWDEPFGFVRMLRAKTALAMEQDYGSGTLDAHLYNAVYMNMKLRHFVRGTVDGQPVLLTAEQVIAHQLTTGTPITELVPDAQLWIPSDNVLRQMLGEQGTQGTSEYNDFFEPNPAAIRRFDRITPEMAAKYGAAGQVALEDTVVAARGRQTQLLVTSHISDATRNAYDMRIQRHNAMRSPIHADRSQIQGFDPAANTQRMASRAGRALKTESLSLDWAKLGMPWIGPRAASSPLTEVMLQQYERMKRTDGNRSGWIYEENVASAPNSGLLSNVDLGNSELRPGLQIAPGDPVAVITSSFSGTQEQIQKRLGEVMEFLANRGADIILVTEDSATENRTFAAVTLTERFGYEKVPGASHAYAPAETSERYQTVRARESLLTETGPITMRNRLPVFLTDGEYITENAAWVVPQDERALFRNVSVGLNLVPTDFLADMNIPRGGQVQATKDTVLALLQSDEGVAMLKDMAGEEQLPTTHVGYTLDEAMARLIERLRKNEGTVLPVAGDSFGTGDLIPLVDVNGHILFYRHGYKAPKNRDAVVRMWDRRFDGELEPRGVAIFPSEQEPLATAHVGTVMRFFDRPGYGLAVEMQIPLQVFGDKLQLEWQGMKYIVGPMPGTYDLPEHGFFPNMGFALIADRDSSDSKEAVGDRLNNFRNAFAFLGIDIGQDLQEFFGLNGAETLTLLTNVANNAQRLPVRLVHDLLTNDFVEPSIVDALIALDGELGGALQTDTWLSALTLDNYQGLIAHAALLYLMTPGALPEHIMQSGGFNDPNATNPNMGSRLMPQLFTQVFDRAPLGSPLRNEMFRRFNRQLYNPNDDGTGYRLLPDWTLEVTTRDSNGQLRTKHGTLQIPEIHSSGDNPLKNGMAFSETDRQPAGLHSQSITWSAFSAETTHSRVLQSSQGFLEQEGIYRFKDEQDGGVWRMLTETTEADRGFETWRMPGPLEIERLAMEREAMVEYRQELNLDGWDSDAKGASRRREYEELRTKVRQMLGLSSKLDVVLDFWVRQMLGRPGGLVEDESGNVIPAPEISAADAIDAMTTIEWNVRRNYLPLAGAEVPALSLIDLQMLYRADSTWAPRTKVGGAAELIDRKNWEAWVEVSLGQMTLESTEVFDPMFLLATDAFMHTYRGATTSLLHLPVSLNQLKELELLDPNTNQMYTSLSRDVNTLLKDPIVLDTERASLRQLMGGERINGRYVSKLAPASAKAKRRKARARWRYDTGTPFPVEGTVADMRVHGQRFVHKTQQTSTFWRVLINLRVGTALINPALWLSAGPESWFRGIMDRASNILTMSGTTGRIASMQAGASERGAARAAEKAAERTEAGKKVGDVTAQGGLLNALTSGARYSQGQQGILQDLYDVLGDRLDFRGMISRETYYLNTRHSGAGIFERGSEQYARLGAAFQDPTAGARTKTIARRYVEGALRYILSQPTTVVMTVESLAAALKTDPAWLQKNFPDAHTAGLNSVAYFRSLNQTLPNKIARGIYEPLGSHSNGAVQAFGNLFLRIPLLFSGYASSVALNLTGMQGFFDAMSMTLDSRNNKFTRFFGKASARMQEKEFNPDTWTGFDMSDVLEGIDLSQSFLRSGATLSGLAMMGMMMGGLLGEDEEMKRRRRQAELLGAPLLYDPRDLANAVANGEAVFLDSIPGVGAIMDALYGVQAGGDDEEDRRVMANLPWVLRAFTAPVLGVARFLETGDPRQVRWGFEDALSSFPLLNRFMYNEVVNTYDDLMTDAAKEAEKGTFEGDVAAMKLITGAIATYENMLFENSFVNTTYVALDRYDRDPFKVVEVTDTGEARQELTPNGSQPYATSGLQDYIDEDGKLNESYLSRDYSGRQLRQLSESRFTIAAVGSILSMEGWKSDFLRYNMAPKTRSFDLPEITADEARAAIADFATEQLGTARFMTPQELEPLLKQQYQDRGVRWEQAAIEKEAKLWSKELQQYIKDQEKKGLTTDSVISEEQKKLLARADAAAVLNGIVQGVLTLDDPALRGFYMTPEMREQIEFDWQKDIIQEGVDFGLTESQARYRMYRIWGGEGTDVGIKDILWSDKINWSDSLEYKQLNTTYVSGPDGMPIATGFTRGGILAGFGVIPTWQWGADAHGGAKAMGSGALGQDSVLNVQDFAVGINTGLRALEPSKESNRIPGDREILAAMERVEKAIENLNFEPSSAYNKTAKGGSGFGSYRRYGGGGGGYGGGGGGSVYYSRLNPLPFAQTPYGNTVPFINTSNPIIRRANIRRERVTSERGRLNQWQ